MFIPESEKVKYNPDRKHVSCKVLNFQHELHPYYDAEIKLSGFFAWFYAGVGNGYMCITSNNKRIWIRGDNLLPVE